MAQDEETGATDIFMRLLTTEQRFSNLSMHQTYVKGWIKNRLQGNTLRVYDPTV